MLDSLRDLRARRDLEGDVLWAGDGTLAVLDPELAARVNAANFSDLTLPGRKNASWQQVRAAWTPMLRQLSTPDTLEQRMDELLQQHVGKEIDLVRLSHLVCTFALAPLVINLDLRRQMLSDIADLTGTPTRWGMLTQLRSARLIRQELRGRASGKRPRRTDLADPIVDLIGIRHAVDAVNALIVAISGPPGAAAACLLYAMHHYPTDRTPGGSRERSPAWIHQPDRFVREVLRMWSPPLRFVRPARCPIDVPGARLGLGQRYLISPYLLHHDSKRWEDADVFNPDRTFTGGPSYVPFGWAPLSCPGAGLGTIQLTVLLRLLTTRYRVVVSSSDGMELRAVAQPVNFRGRLEIRGPVRADA